MIGTLLALAGGLAAHEQRVDALASDVANLSTPGYRPRRFALVDMGASVAGHDLGPSGAPLSLVAADNPLAVAVVGHGYLQARLADGRLALTRLGDLRPDAGGALTVDGARVEPPVVLPPGISSTDVRIAADGTVTAAGRKVGALVVVDVPSPTGLLAVGEGWYVPTSASGAPAPARHARLRQGVVEASGTDLTQAMTGLAEALRSLQLAARGIRVQDELWEIANGLRR